MRALTLWCLAVTASALAAPARANLDALVSVGACVAESQIAGHRPPVVLRVSPWVGGGAQVTLGVRWDDPLGDTESDTKHARSGRNVSVQAAQSAAEPSEPRALVINESRADATNISGDAFFQVATARAGGVVGATVIAIDPGSSLATATAAVETALAVLRGVPRDEEVAVFALVSANTAGEVRKTEKPLLVADFRAPRLGGARHLERRTRAFLRAFAKQRNSVTPVSPVSTEEPPIIDADDDETRITDTRLDAARTNDAQTETTRRMRVVLQSRASSLFDALLGELASWRADPEGPVARDVVLIAPTAPTALRLENATCLETFESRGDVANAAFGRSSVPEGGGWALTTMLADAEALSPPKIFELRDSSATGSASRALVIVTGWGARAAASRAALVRARRRNVARVGVCGLRIAETRSELGRFSFRARLGASGGHFRCSVQAPTRAFPSATHRDEDEDERFFFAGAPVCDAAAAAADAYPYPDAIAIRMSPAQRARFDAKRSFFRGSHFASLAAKTDTKARVQFVYPFREKTKPLQKDAKDAFDRTSSHERVVRASDAEASIPLAAKVRFRGVSSLRDCARRKSMKVNLRGRGRFRLAPGSAGDEFLLISMCYDDRYVKSKLVFSLAKRLGAFPHAARYVRVLIENPLVGSVRREKTPWRDDDDDADVKKKKKTPVLENEGLYLLVDDPVSSLERRFARVETVVRRRNDAKRSREPGKGTPEVKRPKSDEKRGLRNQAALRRYDRLARVAGTCATSRRTAAAADGGLPCYEALDERLDLEQYFRWTALMTLVGSGDHVDETWFYASNENAAASFFDAAAAAASRSVAETDRSRANATRFGESAFDVSDSSGADDGGSDARFARAFRYRVHAWDPDDAFQPCHHSGANALRDPHGLLVCAEGDLDKVFVRDPRTYAAYVDALEWTLRQALTLEVIEHAAANEIMAELRSVLVDDATAAGLAELVAANPDARTRRGALADIEGSLSFYAWTLRERRRTLLRRVARYRDFAASKEHFAEDDFSNGTATDKITVPFEPKRTPARSALRREAARFPFEVDKGSFRRRWALRRLVFSASAREYRYDAAPGSGVQELVARGVAFENESSRTSQATNAANIERLEISLPTVYVPVRAEVRYENVTYVAPPSETRVACFAPPFDDGAVVDHDASRIANADAASMNGFGDDELGDDDSFFANLAADSAAAANASFAFRCALRGSRIVDSGTGETLESLDAVAFAAVSDGFVAFRFARRLPTTTRDATLGTNPSARYEPIRLGPGRRFETKSALSVFHRDWLPFPRGVLRAETEAFGRAGRVSSRSTDDAHTKRKARRERREDSHP